MLIGQPQVIKILSRCGICNASWPSPIHIQGLIQKIGVPAQGKAWDYQGMSKDAREEYYQSIRDICKKYDVELADFSDMEYEPYFFIDTMHLGYKGWAYVDRAIYEFYKE